MRTAALAAAPRLLMLDEPLGALDRALRERLVIELRALFVRLGLSIIFVTHDHDEAFAIADRVVVLRNGEVVEQGSVREVLKTPQTQYTRELLAAVPRLDGAAAPLFASRQNRSISGGISSRRVRNGGSITAPDDSSARSAASNFPSAAKLPSGSALVHTSVTLCFSSFGSRNERPFCSALEYCPISAQ